ncbi:hypothetical protein RJ641_032690 [Dillenia turbinata]|uniref:Uncharacterized protein n=1 Tax=Dillenia turbinata TaxID=194707 RepID=A0AAN8VKC2_9MAGN
METHRIKPFPVEKKDLVLVRPSKHTPSDILLLSSIDNDPNLELICQSVYVYQSNITASNGDAHAVTAIPEFQKLPDPVYGIKEALSNVLVYYYPLAGMLKRHSDGRLRVNCSIGDGVPFLEATANCTLSSLNHLDGIDVPTAKQLVIDLSGKTGADKEGYYHPLLVQVTRFSCGGFTIGMGLSHSICDGFGAAQFFRAMAELASGQSEPTIKPVWERDRLVGARPNEFLKPPAESLATSPYVPTTDISHACFNVSSQSIKRLKQNLMEEERKAEIANHENYTTLEVLGAYVWRSRLRALELNLDGQTLFTMTVSMRPHINPPLPDGYYGNAFSGIHAVILGKDLNEEPLIKAVKLIRNGKRLGLTSDAMRVSLGIREWVIGQNLTFEATGASTCVTDWRQLGLIDQVDFGWKASVNMIPLPWDMFGSIDLCVFMPPCSLDLSMKGGVRVFVSLPRAAMPKFKEEMDALNLNHGAV